MDKKFSISEAAGELAVEAHVLRYWELELGLHISRNNKGHRFYSQSDIQLLQNIKILKEQGFQLKAIKCLLPEINHIMTLSPAKLYELREELNEQVLEETLPTPYTQTAQVMPLRPRNMESAYQSSNAYQSAEEKLRHFEAMMRKMIQNTLEQMQQESEERICEKITNKLLKEMDYLTRQKEELQEKQIKLLEQILAEVHHELPEAAATQDIPAVIKNKEKDGKKGRGKHKKLFAKAE